jgi:excisionase family DNA binding protein
LELPLSSPKLFLIVTQSVVAFTFTFHSCGKLSSTISRFSHDVGMVARFLTLSDVAELLNIAPAQVYTLVRTGELSAIKIGARGQWRVEDKALESYIAKLYSSTAEFVAQNPR